MANISKIKLPNNSQYDLKDQYARERISNHIIFSTTQPSSSAQIAGDVWVVIIEDQEE